MVLIVQCHNYFCKNIKQELFVVFLHEQFPSKHTWFKIWKARTLVTLLDIKVISWNSLSTINWPRLQQIQDTYLHKICKKIQLLLFQIKHRIKCNDKMQINSKLLSTFNFLILEILNRKVKGKKWIFASYPFLRKLAIPIKKINQLNFNKPSLMYAETHGT